MRLLKGKAIFQVICGEYGNIEVVRIIIKYVKSVSLEHFLRIFSDE